MFFKNQLVLTGFYMTFGNTNIFGPEVIQNSKRQCGN